MPGSATMTVSMTIRPISTPTAISSSLQVLPDARRLELRFTSPNTTSPERLQFRIQMKGLDANWLDVGETRFMSYNHLPPGRYEFMVAAAGPDRKWLEAASSLKIEVIPRIYERRSVQFFGALALLAVVSGSVWRVERARSRRRLERLEQQHELERERARIAQDLHDDLGTTLTQIDYLGALAERGGTSPSEAQEQIGQIRGKSREMITALDEIVWAVNPRNDSLQALADYFCHFAGEFLRPASISCRLDYADGLPAFALGADARHNLFLAFKEALNNVVRHSGATEVWIRIKAAGGIARIVIEDNGCGFVVTGDSGMGNGLRNMRERLAQIGGSCEVRSQPGAGTVVEFHLPLTPDNPWPLWKTTRSCGAV